MDVIRYWEKCEACNKLTLHIQGESALGKRWKECEECGKEAKL